MRYVVLAGAVALAAATGTAPAHADHTDHRCVLAGVEQRVTVSSQNEHTGIAYGYAASAAPGDTVSVRCAVEVDGVEVSATPTGTGPGLATTAGPVTYAALYGQVVRVCAEVTSTLHPPVRDCAAATTQTVSDLLDAVYDLIADSGPGWDPVFCGLLKTLAAPSIANAVADVTGISFDEDDCDVYLNGEKLVDFVPYED